MAREESDREDLLREATALVERVELLPSSTAVDSTDTLPSGDPIVAGFRANGSLSLFFGADPVYHFNASGELRRAYVGGVLVKAAKGQLASLERVRTESEVQLVRHPLSAEDQARFLEAMSQQLRGLAALLERDDFELVGQVPAEADVVGRVRSWLAANQAIAVAARPNA